ncbi:hypothetical protein PO909_012430 [Leuciscus waleckii]
MFFFILFNVAVLNNHEDLVKTLLEKGADPNIQNKVGSRALEVARGLEEREVLGDEGGRGQRVALTALHPDIVLWSTECKKIILVELTVPWEEDLEVPVPSSGLQGRGMAGMAVPGGGRLQRFPCQINLAVTISSGPG